MRKRRDVAASCSPSPGVTETPETRAQQGRLFLSGTSHPLLGVPGSSHLIAGETEGSPQRGSCLLKAAAGWWQCWDHDQKSGAAPRKEEHFSQTVLLWNPGFSTFLAADLGGIT